MSDDLSRTIASVRTFTRFYTRIIGLLDEGLLNSPYSMVEARVLFELGQEDEADLIRLRNDLGIDSGYMSRIVARLQAAGIVTTRRSATDARHQILKLTDQGRDAYAMLDGRSAEQIATLLQGLDLAQKRMVVTSMEHVQRLLSAQPREQLPLTFRGPRSGDYGWIIERHGQLYADEFGWDERFEALVARIVADYMADHDPDRERCWIAERDGTRLGCVFVVRHTDDIAKLRLLIVDPLARGTGLGRALVRLCVAFAREAGYHHLVLWTNDVLIGARHIYETEGFQLAEQTPHADFGPPMVGESWALEL